MANTYTAEQVATAARQLRQSAEVGEEQFSTQRVLSMLSDELRLLRETGKSNAVIAGLFMKSGIEVTEDEIAQAGAEDDERPH